jgi:curved DNA-binding protein CbpA
LTTLYAVLGVDPGSDTLTIRRAYRELARRHHPDFGGDTHHMVTINDAWHVLGDRDRRASYDRQIRRAVPRPRPDDGHTVMTFGQYKGWSLADVAKVDENYLHWLSRMPIGRHLHREIGQLLEERAAAAEAIRPRPIARKRRRSRFFL